MRSAANRSGSRDTDVLIVGGGPAGLAAAIAARQKNFEVIVVDRERPSIDKSCGEGLMADGVAALGALGVHIPASESFPVRGIRFIISRRTAEATFPSNCGIGIRRTTLHRILLDRALQLGVEFRWGRRLIGIEPAGLAFDGISSLSARWTIGADGQDSVFRSYVGLTSQFSNSPRFGFRRHFRIAPWSDMAELYWGEKFQIYVTPVNAEEICVVLLSRNRQLRLDQTLPKFPELRARLSNAVSVGSERGGVTRSRLLWRVARHNAALIGDASGSVDAISGQGLGLSFQQAVVLADALEASDLAEYQRAHRRIFAKPFVSSFVLLSLTSNAWLREIVIRRLANNPRLFARLLAYHASSDEELKHNYARIAPKLAARVLNGSG